MAAGTRRQKEAAGLEKAEEEAKRKEIYANEHAAVNDVWKRQIREKEAKKQGKGHDLVGVGNAN